MSKRVLFVVLLPGQLGCIVAGLIFYLLYVNLCLRQTSQQISVHELDQAVRRLEADPAWPQLLTVNAVLPTGAVVSPLFAELSETGIQVALVDANDEVVTSSSPEGNTALAVGDAIAWTASEAVPHAIAGARRGLVRTPAGDRIAFQIPLSAQRSLLLQRNPAKELIPKDSLGDQLVIAGGITALWSAGLLTVLTFLTVNHFAESKLRVQGQPQVESLRQAHALMRTQETIIFALAKLSDSRDPETGDHLERIAYYSTTLAATLRQHPDFRDIVSPTFVQFIGISSALHDIGKVGVEDSILKKPGSLTSMERSRMMRHTEVGENCLREIERRLGTSNFLQMAREIAGSHHERWDGSGYPSGLAGERIPLAVRIVAIADVYDALSSKRVYKEALPHDECVRIIAEEAGKHFDPRLVDIFLSIEANFGRMAEQLRSTGAEEMRGKALQNMYTPLSELATTA